MGKGANNEGCLTAHGEVMDQRTAKLSRRGARLSAEAGTKRDRKLRDGRDITGNENGGERSVMMLGRIDQSVESGTVAARRTMRRQRSFDAVVVPVHHMRHRIERERQHHGNECDS